MPPKLDIDFARSQGQRPYQEDDCQTAPLAGEGHVVVLADGMGGHAGGAVASKTATAGFIERFKSVPGSVADRLAQSLDNANQAIAVEQQGKPELRGMGCTLVGVVFTDEGVRWISVGDSPFWLYRDGHLTRLNDDHSLKTLLEKQVRAGQITREDAEANPNRHMLTSAVSGEEIRQIDGPDRVEQTLPGDVFVLASDGMLTLTEEEIETLMAAAAGRPSKIVARALVQAVDAKGRRGQDNTTVVVTRIAGDAVARGAPPRPQESTRTVAMPRAPAHRARPAASKQGGSLLIAAGIGVALAAILAALWLIFGFSLPWPGTPEVEKKTTPPATVTPAPAPPSPALAPVSPTPPPPPAIATPSPPPATPPATATPIPASPPAIPPTAPPQTVAPPVVTAPAPPARPPASAAPAPSQIPATQVPGGSLGRSGTETEQPPVPGTPGSRRQPPPGQPLRPESSTGSEGSVSPQDSGTPGHTFRPATPAPESPADNRPGQPRPGLPPGTRIIIIPAPQQ